MVNVEHFHFHAAGWNRVQRLGRGTGKGEEGEGERGESWTTSFAAFHGIDCGETSWRASSRVKLARMRENASRRYGKHDRGRRSFRRLHLRAHLSREIVRRATRFPGPFPRPLRHLPPSLLPPRTLFLSVFILSPRERGINVFLHRLRLTDDGES